MRRAPVPRPVDSKLDGPTETNTLPLSKLITTKRHALMGTACALGLIMAPVAGSAVVVAVTTARSTPAATAQVAAPVPVTAAPRPPVPDHRRGR
jgi:hypothetical protein